MDKEIIRRLVLAYYEHPENKPFEKIDTSTLPERIGETWFVPDGNKFWVLEDAVVEDVEECFGIKCKAIFIGNYNPNRRNYPVPMVSLTETPDDYIEIEPKCEVYALIKPAE